jgi:Biopolymer transport proteins
MQPQGLDLIDIIHKGAIATYPLILLSIVSVAVVFERFWSLRNIGAITLRVTESILEPIKKGQRDLAIAICKQNSHSPAGRIFLNILERDASARLEVANSIAAEAMFEENQKLKKHLWILGTVASSAPFIGLLGTVVGIIKSFESMAIAGTGGFAVSQRVFPRRWSRRRSDWPSRSSRLSFTTTFKRAFRRSTACFAFKSAKSSRT